MIERGEMQARRKRRERKEVSKGEREGIGREGTIKGGRERESHVLNLNGKFRLTAKRRLLIIRNTLTSLVVQR